MPGQLHFNISVRRTFTSDSAPPNVVTAPMSSPSRPESPPAYANHGLDRRLPGEDYVHLGIDAEGMHHHYLADDRAVVVAAEGYDRIEEGVRIYYRLSFPPESIEHVEPDLDLADLEGGWCAFVAFDRGWTRRTNRVYDVGPAVWEAIDP